MLRILIYQRRIALLNSFLLRSIVSYVSIIKTAVEKGLDVCGFGTVDSRSVENGVVDFLYRFGFISF